MSNRWGRRLVFLILLMGSLVCNVGCVKSSDHASMAACRALVAFFISPAGAIRSAIMAETFIKGERVKYMGTWTIFVTLGVPVAPFLMGFVAENQSYRWIYWILAIINGGQFLLYILFGAETRYIRRGAEHHRSTFKQGYLTFSRLNPTPLKIYDFIQPLSMGRYFKCILITVEIPQLWGPKFLLDAQQRGIQFAAIIIGTLFGDIMGGALSDAWMNRKARKGTPPKNEYRLWLSYPGYFLAMVRIVVFLVEIQNAKQCRWNVVPDVGAAIAAGGNQLVTTVLITYAVDNHREEAASVDVFITFVRQTWGFIGPFWFPDMFIHVGIAKSASAAIALMVGCSHIPTLTL